jgi:hypothetical protein
MTTRPDRRSPGDPPGTARAKRKRVLAVPHVHGRWCWTAILRGACGRDGPTRAHRIMRGRGSDKAEDGCFTEVRQKSPQTSTGPGSTRKGRFGVRHPAPSDAARD